MQTFSNEVADNSKVTGDEFTEKQKYSKKFEQSEYEYAGFWVRLAAYAIDMTIVTAGLLIVRLVFLGINSLIAGTVLEGNILFHYTLKDIVLYVIRVVYFVLFTYHTGCTLGKRALNLKVIQSDGTDKLSLLTVIYRETIGRFLCGFILCIGYFLVGIDKEKRGLHDILCDTRVIYAKKMKVYPEYQGRTVNRRTQMTTDVEVSVEEDIEDDPLVEKEVFSQTKTSNIGQTIQDDIAEQWNRILNPQKEETIPQNEEQNIEGNP